ncbi:elongator complex protein 6 isoform X1 [Lagopus leucura]|uniref:elongator complex protein 6 isoform X1 n=1 Tax=Lagopus leucura TaxID=30410 RepID=UPI001C66C4C5|nr:elongator complex protein 6 isoform X1 [Lagopus leucura]
MLQELNELLDAAPQRPDTGKFTLLRDSRTDGSFLVHHFLSFYLRAGCKVCFLALVQSFSHYNIVAQKLGISLTAAKEQGQLVFLEGLKSCLDLVFGEEERSGQPSPLQFISGSVSNLKDLFHFVQTSLTPADSDCWKGRVLLVDDLSVLLSLGAAPVDVLDFIHYCRMVVCSQLKVLLPPHTEAKPGFLFVPLCTVEVQKALSLREVQTFAPWPFLGSCMSSRGTFATGFQEVLCRAGLWGGTHCFFQAVALQRCLLTAVFVCMQEETFLR